MQISLFNRPSNSAHLNKTIGLQRNKAEWSAAMHGLCILIFSCSPVIHFRDYVDVIFAFKN